MPRLFELFQAGGPLMWVLLAISVLALVLAAERAWALWRETTDGAGVATALTDAWRHGGVTAMRDTATAHGPAVTQLVATAIDHADTASRPLDGVLEAETQDRVVRLAGGLHLLRLLAELAPVLGFLGTVLGMIVAFEAVLNRGVADPRIVARGLSQALTTSAAGLLVAAPAYLLYALLALRLDRVAAALDRTRATLVRLLSGGATGGGNLSSSTGWIGPSEP